MYARRWLPLVGDSASRAPSVHAHQNAQDASNRILVVGDLRIDRDRRGVTRRGQAIAVKKARLFDLLVYFVGNQGIALTKGQIMAQVWGYISDNTTAVAVHVRWLRELIEDNASGPRLIRTVTGVRYRFVAAPADEPRALLEKTRLCGDVL